ncbi:MAG TPA: peptidoglycan-binding domain-containing protein [Acidimicrobiales bacterium]|nr:peptidoglycan-binding domain-containing protein [Acidimicrobiales bacterium]
MTTPSVLADHLAEALSGVTFRSMARGRAAAQDALAAAHGLAAWAVDPACPEPAIAPDLAAAIGAIAAIPTPIATITRTVGDSGRRVIEDLAVRFASRWTDPTEARMAAGLFVGALALTCAGLVGVVTVAAPKPAVHLQRLAAVVNLVDAPVAVPTVSTPTTSAAAHAPPESTPPPRPATTAPTAAPPAAVDTPATAAAAPPVASSSAPVAAEAVPPAKRGGLPVGKGMWIWMDDRAEGGDAEAIVARAKATGLTHLYVRTGTLKGGFVGGPFLDRLLPVAHANDLRVYGWDFPYLDHPGDDVNRAMAAITYTTPDGQRIDGFSADIESAHEGTNNNLEYVTAYCTWLRQNVGPNYPLIATVPNPTPAKQKAGYPYAAIIPSFDAVAPMVYWMNRDPASDVANAIAFLSQFGKPVFPIGQAYDGGPEGGPPGAPSRESIIRFLQFADGAGGAGVSFWSWQHATPDVWDAVRDAAEFRLEAGGANGDGLSPGMIRGYQTVLNGLGFPVAADGAWGPATTSAVKAYQAAAKLPVTGRVDQATRTFLLRPVQAPIKPD